MIRLVLVCVLTSISALAHGSSGQGSEFLFQPAAKMKSLELELKQNSLEIEFGSGLQTDLTTTELEATYKMGVNDQWALGSTLGYTSGKTKTNSGTTDVKGLQDIQFLANGHHEVEAGSVHYGGTLHLSPGKDETDSDGNTNVFSGGHQIEPYIGYQVKIQQSFVGAIFLHEIELGKRDVTDDTSSPSESEKDGGTETQFVFFWEYTLENDNRFGTALQYVTRTDSKETVGGTTTTTEALSPFFILDFYYRHSLEKGFLKPSLRYGVTTDDKTANNTVEDLEILDLKIAYRLEF